MHRDIASSSLRKLDAVALVTNVTVFMKRDTNLVIEKLDGTPKTHHRVRLKEFLEGLHVWKAVLDETISQKTVSGIPNSYPRIEMTDER
jgi:hypothetical protein